MTPSRHRPPKSKPTAEDASKPTADAATRENSAISVLAPFGSAPFNPAQLSTWAEAWHWAQVLSKSAAFVAAGISIKPQITVPQPTETNHSGIYIPSWIGGPGGFPIPHGDGTFWLHYYWSNGMQGMNAGLVREKFKSFPSSPLYVVGQLLLEVQAGASA